MLDASRWARIFSGSVAIVAFSGTVPAKAAQAAIAPSSHPASDKPSLASAIAVGSADVPANAAPASPDIVVTGSRIVRNGNDAPTPTTVLNVQEIQQRNVANIADYIAELPSIGRGNTPRTTTLFANATGGANQLRPSH